MRWGWDLKKVIVCLFSVIMVFVFAGCSKGTPKDFREASWGSTLDKVIAGEKKKGNENPKVEVDGNNTTVTYKGIIVSGKKAEANYSFVNQLDKPQMIQFLTIFPEMKELLNKYQRKTIPIEEISKLEEKYEAEFNMLPDFLPLDEYRLESAKYTFSELDAEEAKQMINELTKKYGKPVVEKENAIAWGTNRGSISFYQNKYVFYQSSYEIMNSYIKKNQSKGNL
ncbi:hypothetical protein [Paenibacillus sp. NPDC057934]|uniref:hypothetical protein n=1 Tax=Paenibacillus sp. NPDC057934 TaxID=3346282 RepID=UPI0036DD2F75